MCSGSLAVKNIIKRVYMWVLVKIILSNLLCGIELVTLYVCRTDYNKTFHKNFCSFQQRISSRFNYLRLYHNR